MYILAAGQLAWLHLCKQIVCRAERFALARNGLLVLERHAGVTVFWGPPVLGTPS